MFNEKLGDLLNQHAKIRRDKKECEADILRVLDDMQITAASIWTDGGMVEVNVDERGTFNMPRRVYINDLRQVIDCRLPKQVRKAEGTIPR